ncbi:MAG: T9SS type A sorting domain-containing protein, partial [Cloacibacterium sp.]|nr:T9SS type A sorting domain-containing protein [Cloacibacterium sp.]
SMEVSYTPILCNGGKSTVTVSANGGTAPYTGTGSWEVSAGTYTYTVKDANGCEVSKEITISEPSKLSMEVSYTSILCNGGKSTVTVTADGGTAPYTGTGSWEVSAGTYTYTVKDANGCEVSKKITISEPSKLSMEVSYTPILCNGGKSTVTVSANGGTAPYTGTGSWEVSAGTYTYTVKDANGCEVSKEITITQPTPLELTIVAEKLVCYDGKVQLTANVSGGTSPYTYSWSNGETTQMITVGAGSYTVTVKDANGCMISKNVEVKVPTCDGFTTVTQGGWGAKAAGKNWGAYRDANFAAAFPTGLMVGTALRNLKLSSAKAVDDFLPSGSSPRALDKSYVNPGQTYQNVFAGQVVALTLSVRFDEWDANFSSNSIKLGDLIVNSGTFAGWTVYQILAEANKVLAGEAFMYSASQLNAIVDAINNNYDNGKVNLGLLSCPCPTVEKPVAKVAAPAKSTPDVIANQEAVLYPNPSSGEFNLRFDAPKESKILVQIYNAQGTLVADYSSKVVRNNNKASLHVNNSNLAAGLYLVKVKTSTQEKTIKLIIRK